MSRPTIIGVTRVRNEAHIIHSTLDHYGKICDGGIYVLDEASVDMTAAICQGHDAVNAVIRLNDFETDPTERRRLEGWGRDMCLKLATEQHGPNKDLWVLCFDADERIEFDFESFDYGTYDAVSFRLFDFYITHFDVNKQWHEREWMGPEYREITMLFRAWTIHDWRDRQPLFFDATRIYDAGFDGCVRHYGKAISVAAWEEACHYYTTFQPEPFKSKWEARKGQALRGRDVDDVALMSDFGAPLCHWVNRAVYGYLLKDNWAGPVDLD